MSLEARQAELKQHLEAPEMPQLLHPRMADVYRKKVRSLCHAQIVASESTATLVGPTTRR